MPHIYNVMLRAENHEFVLQQAKANSRMCQVFAFNRKTYDIIDLGEIDNKTGKETWIDENTKQFKQKSIESIKETINHIYEYTRNQNKK